VARHSATERALPVGDREDVSDDARRALVLFRFDPNGVREQHRSRSAE